MTAGALIRAHVRRLRQAQLMRYAGYAVPLATATAFALVRFANARPGEALLLALVVLVVQVLAVDVARRDVRVTRARVAAHLDRVHPELEESTALLLARPDTLTLPARLQRERTSQTLIGLVEGGSLDAATAGRVPRVLALTLLLAAVLANLTWLVPRWLAAPPPVAGSALPASIVSVGIEARPPAYTRLEGLRFESGDVSVPEFSDLRVTLGVRGDFDALAVVLGDGSRVRLYDAGDGRWQSPWWPAQATTWQVVDTRDRALPLDDGISVHRIALQSDAAPLIRVAAPDQRLHEMDALPFTLPVSLTVRDDYGVASVTAHATRATGSGERVSFEGSVESLYADDAAVEREVETARSFDGAALGLEPGAEVYLYFEAADARPGVHNVAQSQTLILRWRSEAQAPEIVLDNAVIQVMPEYFRSQRQIIIDSEALEAERDTLAPNIYAGRAQSLAFDQRALRLRYGQFLGEEVGGEPVAMDYPGVRFARPDDARRDDAGDDAGQDADNGESVPAQLPEGHYYGDGHNHGDVPPSFFTSPTGEFGDAMAAIEPYAHFHDQEEQATLFDPETRELLRAALRAMWRSEGELLQFRAGSALPHQYEALALIKRVQNRSRVFAARVGFEPTPVDAARRLTGELDDIDTSGRLAARGRPAVDREGVAAMNALLASTQFAPSEIQVAAINGLLDETLEAARARSDDAVSRSALDARVAFDEWRISGKCADCRARLLAYWQRYAPREPAPAARDEAALDAFSVRGSSL